MKTDKVFAYSIVTFTLENSEWEYSGENQERNKGRKSRFWPPLHYLT